jgi:hypothetical protein
MLNGSVTCSLQKKVSFCFGIHFFYWCNFVFKCDTDSELGGHLETQEVALFIVDDRRNYKEIGLESGTLSWCCLCECLISFGPREVPQTVGLGPHPRRFSCELV